MISNSVKVKNSDIEITLKYDKLEKNLGKLIKLQADADTLHILPKNGCPDPASELLAQTFGNEGAPLRRSCI